MKAGTNSPCLGPWHPFTDRCKIACWYASGKDDTLRQKRRYLDYQGSLGGHAHSMIRDRILRGDYPFGTVLSRRRLAAEFHMSFLPITEALQRLEHEGLVERRPRAGTRVRTPTPDEIAGFYVLREALESQAARLCAVEATAAERVELREMAADLDRAFSPSSKDRQTPARLFRVFRSHAQLHTRIAECARCPVLFEAIEKNRVLVFNFLLNMAAHVTTLPGNFHHDIIEAIASGDPERAEAAMRYHIRFGLERNLHQLAPLIGKNVWRHARNERNHPARQGASNNKKISQKSVA